MFFAGGFIIAYGLTFGDQLLGLALQPATAGNAPQFELPEIVFVSPEEALVQTLLWLSLAVVMPVAVLIAANLLTGRDPARVVRDALAERLATAARFCAERERGGTPSSRPKLSKARRGCGSCTILPGCCTAAGGARPASASLIDEIGRLGLLLLAWLRIAGQCARCAGPGGGLLPRGGTGVANGRGSAR